MNSTMKVVLITLAVTAILAAGIFLVLDRNNSDPYQLNQTSASYLVKQARQAMETSSGDEKELAEKKFEIIFDIYIKSRSYAMLNKLFFWLALVAATFVLLWPSITVIYSDNLEKFKWIKSATIQTTITGIAALTFAFYSQYKDKQVYTETLMRYVLYQGSSIPDVSLKVSEELARIDRGFSFGSILKEEKK